MTMQTDYRFTIQARDVPGVLVRMTQVFARRGCNISSLTVRPPTGGQWSTIVIDAYDVERSEQIALQLQKLVDVNKVSASKRRVDTGDANA